MNPDENFNLSNYSYPPFQATWMQGSVNLTVRGDNRDLVVSNLAQMVAKWTASPISQGDPSSQKSTVANSTPTDKKCWQCSSPMIIKNVNTKNGPKRIYQCTNQGCKNEKGFRTSEFIND
jgi:hypothetical protein